MLKEELLRGLESCTRVPRSCNGCPLDCEELDENGMSCHETLLKAAYLFILSLLAKEHSAENVPCKEAEPWTRQRVLNEAERCVCGQREHDYGGPEDSFRLIAELWTSYLSNNPLVDTVFSAADVAAMMALLKIARLANNPEHMDSWVDLAGYAACGGEIAGKEAWWSSEGASGRASSLRTCCAGERRGGIE